MPRVVHFEIPAENPEKVSKFYTDTFNWKIKKWEGPMEYWLVMTGDKKEMGIDGGIYKMDEKMKREIINTIGVTDIKESVEIVKQNGGKVMGKVQEIKGVGMFVYAKDPEGNKFGMMQPFPDAKMI